MNAFVYLTLEQKNQLKNGVRFKQMLHAKTAFDIASLKKIWKTYSDAVIYNIICFCYNCRIYNIKLTIVVFNKHFDAEKRCILYLQNNLSFLPTVDSEMFAWFIH